MLCIEDRGLKIGRKKTVYLRFNGDGNLDGNSDINLQGENLERMTTFNCNLNYFYLNLITLYVYRFNVKDQEQLHWCGAI